MQFGICAVDPGFKLSDLWQAAGLLFALLIGLAVATLHPSGKDGQFAVVAPAGYSVDQSVALVQSVDGRVMDFGASSNLLIIQSTRPDAVRALYGAGAWLVLDPLRLRGCLGFQPTALELSK
ncbi:hypothetical protein [Variovorax sp. UMC13]|uniref:hypothetical protein n=1 Tax=Variovorax sp. UMC13 TaxID=1862326 RepID=UPI001601AE68|nr:hypothetical protein [Variovorax sp. UMC13]MBB1601055.1 hypothetical protein [Variovorax sp. UMC13]